MRAWVIRWVWSQVSEWVSDPTGLHTLKHSFNLLITIYLQIKKSPSSSSLMSTSPIGQVLHTLRFRDVAMMHTHSKGCSPRYDGPFFMDSEEDDTLWRPSSDISENGLNGIDVVRQLVICSGSGKVQGSILYRTCTETEKPSPTQFGPKIYVASFKTIEPNPACACIIVATRGPTLLRIRYCRVS